MLRSTWKVSADEGRTSHVFVGRRACAHLVLAYRFLVRRPWARIGEMRPDIVPGAVFPTMSFLTNAAKHRALSELQQGEPGNLWSHNREFSAKNRQFSRPSGDGRTAIRAGVGTSTKEER